MLNVKGITDICGKNLVTDPLPITKLIPCYFPNYNPPDHRWIVGLFFLFAIKGVIWYIHVMFEVYCCYTGKIFLEKEIFWFLQRKEFCIISKFCSHNDKLLQVLPFQISKKNIYITRYVLSHVCEKLEHIIKRWCSNWNWLYCALNEDTPAFF